MFLLNKGRSYKLKQILSLNFLSNLKFTFKNICLYFYIYNSKYTLNLFKSTLIHMKETNIINEGNRLMFC